MILVVDASVAVKWYIEETHTEKAEILLEREFELHAPELILPEVGNILWKKLQRDELTDSEASKILSAFGRQNIRLHPHRPLLKAAFIGASLSAQTVYDWTYLALAVSLSCRFVTADERFFKALQNTSMKNHLIWIGEVE